MKPSPVLIPLDRPRAISWSNRARYRLGTLEVCPRVEQLVDPDRAYTALCAFLWAMLADKPEDFASPEILSRHVDSEKLGEYVTAISEAMGVKSEEAKNANGSTPSPSPASSSD